MQRLIYHSTVGAVFALAILPVGCNQQQALPGNFEIAKPATIQVDGIAWAKEEWSKKIDALVSNHFLRAPQLVDNPSLGGEAVCYSNGSKQRVYWVAPLDDSCRWAMIEFQGSRGSKLVEGNGAPFLELLFVDP